MDQRFVMVELVKVEIREECGAANANASRPGNRLRRQSVIDDDLNPIIHEVCVHGLLQPRGELVGRLKSTICTGQ